MLLKDKLHHILRTFEMKFSNDEGKNILKKLARDERMINYNSLFFKTGNPVINNFDFLERFGTLYDILLDLRKEKVDTDEALREQNEMITKIEELGNLVLLDEKGIKEEENKGAKNEEKTKTQRKEIIASQRSVLKDV